MKALLTVDIQNDFLPGGALAVADGDQVIPIANRLIPHFDLVVATQDWHPANHESFAANHPGHEPGQVIDLHELSQVLWPVHCVQESEGAAFASSFNAAAIKRVFRKGTDPTIDSYSGFFDNGHRKGTGLAAYLKERGVDHLTVMGLATDYCVKFTVLDALKLGFKIRVIADGCRGVNLKPKDSEQAFHEMAEAGAEVVKGESSAS